MANNHQGMLEHGLRIIREISKVSKESGLPGAIKFQYRHLDTYLHPEYKKDDSIKHMKRFKETKLNEEDFFTMVKEVKKQGLKTICTPFDEESVDIIVKHGIEIIKIASPTFQDWPLIEKIAMTKKPVIASTGGAAVSEIDKVVSFFGHRNIPLTLMHCVALYPTEEEDLHLNRIDLLKNRYPFLRIGFSTHEHPDNYSAIKIAIAKGAKVFEKHVGVPTDNIKLNKYSATPEQIKKWLESAKESIRMCGSEDWEEVNTSERESLDGLMRGTFAKREIKKGKVITKKDVFFAFPLIKGKLSSGEFKPGIISNKDYVKNEPIDKIENKKLTVKNLVYDIIHQAKGLLYQSKIVIGPTFSVELSHHYGVENFDRYGAIIIDVINREYCKKIIVQVPGQEHPEHYHEKKEETFHILYGEVYIRINGEEKLYKPGDVVVIEKGTKHSFRTDKGVVFEEISTTHFPNDSFYTDPNIYTEPELRKTKMKNW